MDHEQKQIKEFMLAFNQQCPDKPCVPDLETRKLRLRLVFEEAFGFFVVNTSGELVSALDLIRLKIAKEPDLTEIADACADLNYVTKGTAIACGLDMQPIFDEVHRSNMSKMWKDDEFATCTLDLIFTANSIGWQAKDQSGKIIKSPSYSPANIQPIIEEQSK